MSELVMTPVPDAEEPSVRQTLTKVPEVTMVFWLIKITATTGREVFSKGWGS